MDWKRPYIVLATVAYHPCYSGIGIFNTLLCSFLEIPMEYTYILTHIAYSVTPARWLGWIIRGRTCRFDAHFTP